MWLRVVTAIAALVSAAVHLILWFDGYRDVDVIGPAFLVNAVAGTVIAVLLLRWRHWLPAFLTVGFGASLPVGNSDVAVHLRFYQGFVPIGSDELRFFHSHVGLFGGWYF